MPLHARVQRQAIGQAQRRVVAGPARHVAPAAQDLVVEERPPELDQLRSDRRRRCQRRDPPRRDQPAHLAHQLRVAALARGRRRRVLRVAAPRRDLPLIARAAGRPRHQRRDPRDLKPTHMNFVGDQTHRSSWTRGAGWPSPSSPRPPRPGQRARAASPRSRAASPTRVSTRLDTRAAASPRVSTRLDTHAAARALTRRRGAPPHAPAPPRRPPRRRRHGGDLPRPLRHVPNHMPDETCSKGSPYGPPSITKTCDR